MSILFFLIIHSVPFLNTLNLDIAISTDEQIIYVNTCSQMYLKI